MYFFDNFSVICTLGNTNTSSNGTFNCPTPHVIPNVYRSGASMAEVSRQPFGQIQIYMSVGPNSVVNATSFTINFGYSGTLQVYVSYFLIAIGNQPENDWIDLLPVYVPADPLFNSLMNGQDSVRSMSWQYGVASFLTRITSLTGITLVPFISSYCGYVYSGSALTTVQLTAWILNSTDFMAKV